MLRPKKLNILHSKIPLPLQMLGKANPHLHQFTSILKKKVELFKLTVKLLVTVALLIS